MFTKRAAARAVGFLLLLQRSTSSTIPPIIAGGDLVASLKEYGDAPVRTVSCAGAQGSGKTTLMRSMFGAEAGSLEDGLALLEVDSDCAYLPETNEFQVGTGQAMVSLAVSDVMVYNVLVHDLRRPDALSELQPAFEELLSLYEDAVVDPEQQKTLVIVVRDCEEDVVEEVKQAVEERLKTVWEAAVKPEDFESSSLESVVDVSVSCLPHHTFESDKYQARVAELKSSIMDGAAETPAEEVARLLQQISSYAGPATESVGSSALQAAFVAGGAVVKCMASFQALVARMGASFTELNTEFGDLCDGVMDTVLDEFDRAVEGLRGGGAVIARKRAELTRAMLRELGERHAVQATLVRAAAREKFDQALAGLRVSPDVGKAMGDAIQEADKYFTETMKQMRCKYGSWPWARVRQEARDQMREFATERLQLVQAQGVLLNMKKRKPVGMAFHWFLPRPFGSEARKSVLDRDDPMRYTHPPHRSSPMFFDLAASEENEVLMPSDVGKDVTPNKDIEALRESARRLVRNSSPSKSGGQ